MRKRRSSRRNPVPRPYSYVRQSEFEPLSRAMPDLKLRHISNVAYQVGDENTLYYTVQIDDSGESSVTLFFPSKWHSTVQVASLTVEPVNAWRIRDLARRVAGANLGWLEENMDLVRLLAYSQDKPTRVFRVRVSHVDEALRGQGGGRLIYELMLMGLKKKFGRIILAADELFGGTTSYDAQNVWSSLRKTYTGGHLWVSGEFES